jgi:hypothetical protein
LAGLAIYHALYAPWMDEGTIVWAVVKLEAVVLDEAEFKD